MKLNEQISKHNYYSFLWHAVFLALAINFMDVDTIIPAMMVDAGGSSTQLGILTAIMLGGARFAQLFFAPFLSNKPSKKDYLLGGINARIFALGGMALLFYFSFHINNNFIIWTIFILISLFSLSGAFANINYVDILGKSVLQEKRKAFFSIKQVISSTVVFLSAFIAKSVLSRYAYPINYATLFLIAAVLLGIASFIAILIPLIILMMSGSILFPYIFLVGGAVFAIHRISMSGILLKVTNNENRALYTGLSGAGSTSLVIFPFIGGWLITEFGFNLFFVLFIAVIFSSFYFIWKIKCKK